MNKVVTCTIAGLAVICALGIEGCSSDSRQQAEETEVGKKGTLTMELQTVSASGKVYRLRQAFMLVDSLGGGFPIPFPDEPFPGTGANPGVGGASTAGSGPLPGAGGALPTTGGVGPGGAPGSSSSVVLSSEDDPTRPVIEAFLQEGSYQMLLLDGWFIEQVDLLLGASAFVDAILLNGPFQFFDIESNGETFVKYEFEVDGERVVFGPPGRLIVGIGVTERNGQGSFCGNGIIDPGELCDGFDVGGETCASATMGARPFGFLSCTADCLLDTTFCEGDPGGFDGGGGMTGEGGSSGLDAGRD